MVKSMTKTTMLDLLKVAGIELPAKESLSETSLGLTIFERLKTLQEECEKEETGDLLEEFSDLVYDYPYSMLSGKVTHNEATLICLFYFYRPQSTGKYQDAISEYDATKLSEAELKHYLWDRMCDRMQDEDYHFYSYEELAKLFNRSKATIYAVIQNHKDRVRELLDADRVRARRIAMERLIEEEKAKLRASDEKERENERTNR
jgi:hypothetical protein